MCYPCPPPGSARQLSAAAALPARAEYVQCNDGRCSPLPKERFAAKGTLWTSLVTPQFVRPAPCAIVRGSGVMANTSPDARNRGTRSVAAEKTRGNRRQNRSFLRRARPACPGCRRSDPQFRRLAHVPTLCLCCRVAHGEPPPSLAHPDVVYSNKRLLARMQTGELCTRGIASSATRSRSEPPPLRHRY